MVSVFVFFFPSLYFLFIEMCLSPNIGTCLALWLWLFSSVLLLASPLPLIYEIAVNVDVDVDIVDVDVDVVDDRPRSNAHQPLCLRIL